MSAVFGKGVGKKMRYQKMMAKEWQMEEVMNFRIQDVHKELDEEDRAEMSSMVGSSNQISFFEYLTTMLEMIESKLTMLP